MLIITLVVVALAIYLAIGLALAIWMCIERRGDSLAAWEILGTIFILPFGLSVCLAGSLMLLAVALVLSDDLDLCHLPE